VKDDFLNERKTENKLQFFFAHPDIF